MVDADGSPPRLPLRLVLTTALFVASAALGFWLGGTGTPPLTPLTPGGPEVLVELPAAVGPTFSLQVPGFYAYVAGGADQELKRLPLATGRGPGLLRVTATRSGLRLLRPDGPPEGESIGPRLRIRGTDLRRPGRDQPIWGAIEVRRKDDRTVLAVNALDIETYLQGVLLAEMGSSFPAAALRAQAVAARSYALARILEARRRGRERVLKRSDLDQVFRPVRAVPGSVRRAVAATRGLILGRREKPLTAYYHSTCGGATRDAAPAFDPASPIRGHLCRHCRNSRYFAWERVYDRDALVNALCRHDPTIQRPITRLSIRPDRTGHAACFRLTHRGGTTDIPADRFRSVINRTLAADRSQQVLSTRVTALQVVAGGRRIRLIGHGWGHGVGMCQMGAAGLAREGADFRRILAYYYGDTPLVRAWDEQP